VADSLKVFGDPKRFRTRLLSRIERGKQILLRIDGAGDLLASKPGSQGLRGRIEWNTPIDGLDKAIDQWSRRNQQLLSEFLGANAESIGLGSVPRIRLGALSPTPRPDLAPAAEYIRSSIELLSTLERRLPAPRAIAPREIAERRLADLRSTGLLDVSVIDSFEERLAGLANRKDWRRAIGAAKELVEALHLAILDALDEPRPTTNQNFVKLGKTARVALQDELDRQSIGVVEVDRSIGLDRSLGSLLQSLAEFRNDEGDGHGQPRVNPNLSRRHVELAVDCSLAYTRYLLAALNEAGRLPRTELD
jgi:hypothetical protein